MLQILLDRIDFGMTLPQVVAAPCRSFIAKVAIIWTIGIIVVVVGAILALLGMAGHAIGGRRHYF